MITPAGMYPFCLFNRKPDYMSLLARKAATVVKAQLLKNGGVLTTISNTGQQWDAPNGWAPLQYMTVWGFQRCGQRELRKRDRAAMDNIERRCIQTHRPPHGKIQCC